jgi:hypothetical protein
MTHTAPTRPVSASRPRYPYGGPDRPVRVNVGGPGGACA